MLNPFIRLLASWERTILTIQFDHPNRQTTAPEFRLATPSGEMIALDDYYEKGSLVLLFIPQDFANGDMASVNEIIAQQKRIEGENAHIVAISSQPFADFYPNQDSAFPNLVDAGDNLRASYSNLVAPGLIGEEAIFIFILDTYGAPYICLVGVEPGEDFVDEILSWLLYISIQCPE